MAHMEFGWALHDETHSASVRTVHLSLDMKGEWGAFNDITSYQKLDIC